MKTAFTYLFGYILAVITAFAVGSFFQTQMLINGITSLGFEIPLSIRFVLCVRDLWGRGRGGARGFFSGYLGLILVAFAIAFPAARLLIALRSVLRLIPGFTSIQGFLETIAYPAAGAVAIWYIHFSLQTEYPAGTLFSGARGPLGLGLQIFAGALGGFVFFLCVRNLLRNGSRAV